MENLKSVLLNCCPTVRILNLSPGIRTDEKRKGLAEQLILSWRASERRCGGVPA